MIRTSSLKEKCEDRQRQRDQRRTEAKVNLRLKCCLNKAGNSGLRRSTLKN
jgi:hypothetical protein